MWSPNTVTRPEQPLRALAQAGALTIARYMSSHAAIEYLAWRWGWVSSQVPRYLSSFSAALSVISAGPFGNRHALSWLRPKRPGQISLHSLSSSIFHHLSALCPFSPFRRLPIESASAEESKTALKHRLIPRVSTLDATGALSLIFPCFGLSPSLPRAVRILSVRRRFPKQSTNTFYLHQTRYAIGEKP